MVSRFVLFVLLLFVINARAMKLSYYAETSLPYSAEFRKTKVGGLSALVYHEHKLWALSDDKGQFAEPRLYLFDLNINKEKVTWKAKDVVFISGVPASSKEEKLILDPEGLVLLAGGDLLVSSENNNDKKPRVAPRLLHLAADGKFKSDVVIPDKFIPEPLGQQEKGLRHNAGFEGLTQTADGEWVFAAAESAIMADITDEDEADKRSRIRILKYNKKQELVAEYGYRMDSLSVKDGGAEIFRGVSEILAVNENKILVMERGVRLKKTGWIQTVALYLADFSAATNVAKVKSLSEPDIKLAHKEKLLDFETDLKKQRPKKEIQNFEGLAWGPVLPNKKKSLLIVSDNNFSKKEITELLVFSVEGE